METEIRNIHQNWANESKLAKQKSSLDKALLSLSNADKSVVETLEKLDNMSGGKLNYLHQIYQAIKQSN